MKGKEIQIETDRLLLRQWEERDFEPFAKYYADEETAKYVGGKSNRDQAWRRMASLIGHWVLRGYGYWAIEEKATARFAGCVGLWFSDGWPELELGYWLMREMQGNGYAVEAALASRQYAFDIIGTETLVSYIHPNNEPSKRVAEKCGARYEETIDLLDLGRHCVYRYLKPNE